MARRNAGRCRKYESSRLRTMIPMVVTPPRIAARVSLCASCSNESSLPMWTCGSKSPGSTTLPPASSTSCAAPESFSPMAAMRPPQMPISAATVPTPGMTSVPLRTTRSKRRLTAGSCGHGGGRSSRAPSRSSNQYERTCGPSQPWRLPPTARAVRSLAGAEPLRLQLGEKVLALEIGEVTVDFGQQFLVLEPRVDADHPGIPNRGIAESGVIADRVAQDRQRIDDRLDAAVLEVVDGERDRIIGQELTDLRSDGFAHVALAGAAELHADFAARQIFRLLDGARPRRDRADAGVEIRVRKRDPLGALGGPGQRRDQHVDALGGERGNDAFEIDLFPGHLHAHAPRDLLGHVDVVADKLAVGYVLERRILGAAARDQHALLLDRLERGLGVCRARGRQNRRGRDEKELQTVDRRHRLLPCVGGLGLNLGSLDNSPQKRARALVPGIGQQRIRRALLDD